MGPEPKARPRRLAPAISVLGGGAVYFERQTYQGWQELYPDGSCNDYREHYLRNSGTIRGKG